MSDCSTNAMRPKEPKTCGNCGNVYEVELHCGYADRAFYYRGVTSPNANPCRHWVEGDNIKEQRYQQLEQVAKTMYKSLSQIQVGKLRTSIEFCVDACKYGLEACGVILDDI